MSGQFGVANVCKVMDVVIEIGNVSGAALADGKITVADAGLLLSMMDEFMALGGVNWQEFPKEIKDIDLADLEEIKKHFNEKFDIPQDKLEAVIEQALAVVAKVVAVAFDVKDLVVAIKNMKSEPAPAPAEVPSA